jgi:hypothetical protein
LGTIFNTSAESKNHSLGELKARLVDLSSVLKEGRALGRLDDVQKIDGWVERSPLLERALGHDAINCNFGLPEAEIQALFAQLGHLKK